MAAAPRGVWSYRHELGTEVRLYWRGEEYFRQRVATDRVRPYAHPVSVPGGPPLTCWAPHDHVWHAGLWFNWKFIDGVNYWEHGADGRPEGRIRLLPPERVEAQGHAVRLRATYAYAAPGRERVASEERELLWHPPADDGTHALDYTVRFAAGEAGVVLDRTPITPETPWGGYGGLSWRFCRGLGDVGGLDAAGRRDRAVEHQAAAWATLFGRLDGGPDLWAGVAMFDHPDNPRHPSPWRFIADPGFAYLNPSPLLARPLEVGPGEVAVFRYRVLVYPGRPDPARLERHHRAFATGAPPPPP